MDFHLRFDPLTGHDVDQIRQLAAHAAEVDGAAPLNDQTLVNLSSDDSDITHIVARAADNMADQVADSTARATDQRDVTVVGPADSTRPDPITPPTDSARPDPISPPADSARPNSSEALARAQIVGYAQVDRRQATITGELVVAPAARRHGIGRALLRSAIRDAALPSRSGEPGQHVGLHIWSHSGHPGAAALAASERLVPVREINRMIRPLAGIAQGTLACIIDSFSPQARITTIDPAQDNRRWLQLNSAAFRDHPEQGGWSLTDLEERQQADWFDPQDFYLVRTADESDSLIAAVWMKIATSVPSSDAAESTGEIYVLAVSPEAQGQRWGTRLTELALAHLKDRGVTTAELWTDTSNKAAVATYRKTGFTVASSEIQYARAARLD